MEPFFERHEYARMKNEIDFPLVEDPAGVLVPAFVSATIATAMSGNPVAGIAIFTGVVVGSIAVPPARKGIRKIRAIRTPFHKRFDFHPDDFVIITGFKKSESKTLVDPNFKPIKEAGALPQVDEKDKNLSEEFADALGLYAKQTLYSREHLEEKEDEFMTMLLDKDILAVGGPIPIDPLYEVMIEKAVLPCNYELKNPLIHLPSETGIQDKTYPKYEIVIKGREEPLIPEWNNVDWGLITCVEKNIIFEKGKYGKGKGLFFNISGCHGFGTKGAGLLLLDKEWLVRLADQVEKRIGKCKNFQAIVKVPINPKTKGVVKPNLDVVDAYKVH